MQWPQIIVLIEFLLWFGGVVHSTFSDRSLSHAGALVFLLVMFLIIAGNALVLSAGGFW